MASFVCVCVAPPVVPELTALGLRVVVFYLPLASPAGTAYPHPPLPPPAHGRASPPDDATTAPAINPTAAAGASGGLWGAFGRSFLGQSHVGRVNDGRVVGTVYDLDYISAELQRVLLELQLVK